MADTGEDIETRLDALLDAVASSGDDEPADIAGVALAEDIQRALDDARPVDTVQGLDESIAAEADALLAGDFATVDDVMSDTAAARRQRPAEAPAGSADAAAEPEIAGDFAPPRVTPPIPAAARHEDESDSGPAGEMQSVQDLLDEETAEHDPTPPEDSYDDVVGDAPAAAGSRQSIEATLDQMLEEGESPSGDFSAPDDVAEPATAAEVRGDHAPPRELKPAPKVAAPPVSKPVKPSPAPAASHAPASAATGRGPSLIVRVLALVNRPLNSASDEMRNLIGLIGLVTMLMGACLSVHATIGGKAAMCLGVVGAAAIAMLAMRLTAGSRGEADAPQAIDDAATDSDTADNADTPARKAA